MRGILVIVALFSAATAAPSGPVKISDNNIENIYNININIQGVFTNHIEQDIISVIIGLLNKQSVDVDGATLKDQLLALAQKSGAKDLNLDVPVNTVGKQFSFDGLADKIKEAIASKSEDSGKEQLTL